MSRTNEKRKTFSIYRVNSVEVRRVQMLSMLSLCALSYWMQFSLILIRGDVFSHLLSFFYENHPILYRSFGRVIATLYMLIHMQQQADSVSGTRFPTMYA